MAILISDVISTKIFKNHAKILSGRKGLNRNVKSVTVMEVKDFTKHSIDEDLLILTTFSISAGNVTQMEEIFLELIQKKISGLVIKINRYINNVPESLLKIAENNDTPLIQIDETVFFSEVILSVASLIINSQYQTIQMINQEYETMNSLILQGETLNGLIKHIGKSLEKNCYYYLFDGYLTTKYIVNKTSEEPDFKNLVSEFENQNTTEVKKDNDISNYYICPKGKYYTFPCMSDKSILGYFIIENNQYFPVKNKDILLSKQYAKFLTIKQMEVLLLENQHITSRRHTLHKLLYDDTLSRESIRKDLKILGTETAEFYYIIVLECKEMEHYIKSYAMKKKILQFLKITPDTRYLVENIYNDLVIMFFFDENSNFNEEINSILEKLAKYINTTNETIKIGCSLKNSDIKEINKSLTEAKEAILIGTSLHPEKNIYYFDHFIEITLFANLLDTKEYKRIRAKIIKPLEKSESNNKLNLIKTLQACIDFDTLNEAADSLHIHINTLRYRIEKIKELTGYDITTNFGRQTLSNAVMIYKLEKLFNEKNDRKKIILSEIPAMPYDSLRDS